MLCLQKRILLACLKLFLIMLLCLSTTSCWSSKNVEDQTYATVIGFDYRDELYYIYMHEMNFKEIDKPAIREGNASKGILVGTGFGKTMYEAADSLARTVQGTIDWGHIEAIVATENAMKKDSIGLIRKMNRFPDTRTNSWFFITTDSIEDILSTSNMYDDASMRTILYNPLKSYKDYTHIKPMLAFKAIANYFEPDRTIIIPVITINNDQWQSNHIKLNLLEINGAYVASLHGNHELLDGDEAHLLRVLFQPSRFTISLLPNGESHGVVSLSLKKKEIKANIIGSDVTFDLTLNYAGGLFEFTEYLTYEEVVNIVKDEIEADIREAYAVGLEKQVDLLNLMPSLRQKNPTAWHQLTDEGKTFILNEQSLQQININVRIPFNGKYKRVPDILE